MESSCRHLDIRTFDGVRCCLACGAALFDPPEPVEDLPEDSPTTYAYKPLIGQEIRLITLFPGDHDDDLFCDIVHVNLPDSPKYEVLSCAMRTLDGESRLKKLLCHGKPIFITENCDLALRRLRSRGGNRYLWMQAVCIDHKHLDERNAQVSLIPKIVSSAVQVTAYLGEEDNWLDALLEYILGNTLLSEGAARSTWVQQFFAGRPWFQRIWSFQEIACAQITTMLVGNKVVHLEKAAANLLDHVGGKNEMALPNILRWMSGQHEKDPLATLQDARYCMTDDPRDKVFSLVGLVDPGLITVDYRKDVESVYTDLAVDVIKRTNTLSILSTVLPPNPFMSLSSAAVAYDGKGLPSWVPNWSVKSTSSFQDLRRSYAFTEEQRKLIWDWEFRTSQTAESSKEKSSQYLESIEKELVLSASFAERKTFDHLAPWTTLVRPAYAIDTLSDNLGFALSRKYVVSLDRFSFSGTSPNLRLRVRGHKLDTIQKRTPSYGFRANDLDEDWVPGLGSWKACVCRADEIVKFDVPYLKYQYPTSYLHCLLNDTRTVICRPDQVEVYTENSVAFVPEGFSENDTIWALDGADTPIVLRKIEDHYVFVGECHLYGALRQYHPCISCGRPLELWPMTTEWIEIS